VLNWFSRGSVDGGLHAKEDWQTWAMVVVLNYEWTDVASEVPDLVTWVATRERDREEADFW
jgi:hypothetical protein